MSVNLKPWTMAMNEPLTMPCPKCNEPLSGDVGETVLCQRCGEEWTMGLPDIVMEEEDLWWWAIR